MKKHLIKQMYNQNFQLGMHKEKNCQNQFWKVNGKYVHTTSI